MELNILAPLQDIILEKISTSEASWVSFSEYMNATLYHPSHGYYSRDVNRFGLNRDFVTAPEIGPELAYVIGAQILPLLRSSKNPVILELGAGSGVLARDIINYLSSHQEKSFKYEIIEVSKALIKRQKEVLSDSPIAVKWNSDPKDLAKFDCIVVANEYIDALPVDRFIMKKQQPFALGVSAIGETFKWSQHDPDANLIQQYQSIGKSITDQFTDGYTSEYYNPIYFSDLKRLLEQINGFAFFIDYGLPEKDYYYSDRIRGTLTCYAGHKVHDNPFINVGFQDVTSWVNFTYFYKMIEQCGWKLNGFTTQAEFIINGGIDQYVKAQSDSPSLEVMNRIKKLILPGEMGENVKVIVFEKSPSMHYILPGKSLRSRL
jgi:SAM-dependent MidA family methyltransferase